MSFKVQGWCPGALRPMASGDGLVVRVRPPSGRLTQAQAMGIAKAARRYGNGLIDLSGRANVQLRGVTPETHTPLITALTALDLIDANVASETRRNIIVTPFADATTYRLAEELPRRLNDAPELPGKFGFILDCGAAPVMSDIQADIRFERSADGQRILRAAGCDLGAPVREDEAAEAAIALATWFLEAGGVTDGRGRMAQLIAEGARPEGMLTPRIAPAPALPRPEPGRTPHGALIGFAFGQMDADRLNALAMLGPIRVTPWRMVLIEGLTERPRLDGLITDPADPLLRVHACTGAPGCLQAHGPTRDLARRLAPQVPRHKTLHVSGCAKGCAWPLPADLTFVATSGGLDLIRKGRAADRPERSGISASDLTSLSELF
ncbi:precorrin-3B synthase [Celeribacter neptunius]|uniref:Precorrin-3B synthase n=1 Tax=Celeribacter neptunius TaxID=588602 RepID=A0A1I3PQC3_9RHOB|nr:precorrin-3B synthase [Celeribacter neptunius]SFJ23659.1 precorrin-3B synthase [Celeribacter neptunius]